MRLAYKFNIGNNENISSLCKISNNLYNQALYIFRETLSKEGKWLSYFELDAIMKNTNNLDGDINYRLLKAKCELAGIEIVIHEESYTSKCDSLAFEKIGKHENYLGKRKKRGLFQSSVGKLINADVNGALNIMRKVVGDSCESIRRIIDRGLLFNPVRITNVFC